MNKEIEHKWQKKWEEAKLFQSNHGKEEKVFLTVAYPYPSGAMHIGHGRTYTVPDVYARFKRMQGKNVLFPMAWHVTGAPVIGIASRIKNRDPWTLDLYENVHKVPKDHLSKLEDPEYIVEHFSSEYHQVMSDMGYSIDWRREFKTTDPTYQKFIEWQLRKLKTRGLVRKGNHPVKYCPNCDNPVGDHDLLEGEGVEVNELTLLKFEIGGKYLVPATFRPETIYGATNLWLNPEVEYIEVETNGERWIISEKSFYNLSNQIKDLKIIGEIAPYDLIGEFVKNPITEKKHPILPASFVDPEYGSGTVFSVPGHAPADYIALQDLKNNNDLINKFHLKDTIDNIQILNVVTLKKYSQIPAKDVIEKLGVENQEDPKLEEATNELYKVEHSKGVMSSHIPNYAGERVAIARENIKSYMRENSLADIMFDFAEHPVICRCGNRCVVKVMDNQWFLKYSDEAWKEKTRECLKQENIIPNEVRSNFEYYIGWFNDWACSRRIGLGTHLPWDDQWLIEPLSDSTIYMAYYTIANYLKEIDPQDLNDAFFEKVFFNIDSGEVNVDGEIVESIQKEFSYWYPLDWRLSAKDLIGNHLSFHMFHHAAIFPKENWPQGMVVFGMGLLEGNKMSSSKGNVILLSEAIEKYSADVVRLFLMASAEPWQDFDWREKEVIGTKRRLDRLFEFGKTIEDIKGFPLDLNNIKKVELSRKIDLWMINQLNNRIKETTEALEGFQTRKALQNSLFLLKKDIDHYTYRVKHLLESKESDEAIVYVLSIVFKSWIRILAPFIPHSSEELWSSYGGEGFVVEASWPSDNIYFKNQVTPDLNTQDEDYLSPEIIEKSEELIQGIVHDIHQIKKIVDKDPEKIHIYLADTWKWDLYQIADEVGKPDIGQIMGRAIGQKVHSDKKEIASFAKRISREMTKTHYIGKIDEYEILKDGKDFIEEEVNTEIIIHQDDSYDPEDKAKNAIPYKPAIYME